ncbi:hypothetical protein D3C79_648050 [compost metagenome]
MNPLDTVHPGGHAQMAATQQAHEQHEIEHCHKARRQRRQQFTQIAGTHQHAAQPADEVELAGLEEIQQVVTVEQCVAKRDRAGFQTLRQNVIFSIDLVAPGRDQADIVMGLEQSHLAGHAIGHQAVIVTEELDVVALALLQPVLQIPGKTQRLRVTQVNQWMTCKTAQLIDHRLDLRTWAVVADDDFEVCVILSQGADQSSTEVTGVAGGNDEAD